MIVVLMGVSGSGKTTVGRELARQLGWTFRDADDYHPAENIAKLHAGIPLDDEDRRPWLAALARLIDEARSAEENFVLACSALKHSYQDYLKHGLDEVRFVLLRGSPALIKARLEARTLHFMNPVLLHSQLDTLQPPDEGIEVDVSGTPEEIAREIRTRLAV